MATEEEVEKAFNETHSKITEFIKAMTEDISSLRRDDTIKVPVEFVLLTLLDRQGRNGYVLRTTKMIRQRGYKELVAVLEAQQEAITNLLDARARALEAKKNDDKPKVIQLFSWLARMIGHTLSKFFQR